MPNPVIDPWTDPDAGTDLPDAPAASPQPLPPQVPTPAPSGRASAYGRLGRQVMDATTGAAKSINRMAFNLGRAAYETPVGRIPDALFGADVSRAAFGVGADAPEYGAFDGDLQYANTAEKIGGIGTDIATALIPVGGIARTANLTGRAARMAASAAKEGTVGAVIGQAQQNDAGTGAAFGAGMGAILPQRGAAALKALADTRTRYAATQVGRAINPTTKANKRFVERNAESIIRQSPWFQTLESMQARAIAASEAAGKQINDVLAGVRQGDRSSQLRGARKALQTAAQGLLTAAGKQRVELAPKTREALEAAAQGLASANPRSTSLQVLEAAHGAVSTAIADVGMEVTRRSRQIFGATAVRDAFDAAVQSGAVSKFRTAARGARAEVDQLAAEIAPSRIRTAPLIDRLNAMRRTFVGVNDAGDAVMHNPEAASKLDDLVGQIAAYGDEMNVDQVVKVRRLWDDIVAGADGKGFLSNLADESRRGATKMGANALRSKIASQVPGLVKPNKAFNFNRNLTDAVGDTLTRRTGQTGGLMAGIATVAGGAAGGAGALLSGGPAAILGATVPAVLYYATKLVKSPSYNLFAAKSRLALADALRAGDVERVRAAMVRLATEARTQQAGGLTAATAAVAPDLTDEEYQFELDKIMRGENITPGVADEDTDPDDAYFPDPYAPAPDGIGDEAAQDALDDDLTGLGDGGLGGAPEAEGEPQAAAGGPPQVMQAGMVSPDTLQRLGSLIEPAQRPLVDLPEVEGYPRLNRALGTLEQFTSPLDIATAAIPMARGLLPRATRMLSGADRAVSGALAAQGASHVRSGLDSGDYGEAFGGAMQGAMGVRGMRHRGPDPTKAARGTLRDRMSYEARDTAMQVALSPALAVTAGQFADTEILKKAIPNDTVRQWVTMGLASMASSKALSKADVTKSATAYLQMTDQRKLIVQAAGRLSMGTAPRIVERNLRQVHQQALRAKYPTWDDAKIEARLTKDVAAAMADARGALANVDADSGRKASDVRTYERGLTGEQNKMRDWYAKTRGMTEELLPTRPNEPRGKDGLTARQEFALEAMAAFGTNTDPQNNWRLFKVVADKMADAPAGDRRDVLAYIRDNHLARSKNLFGLNKNKPGVPALRNLVTGKDQSLGGRKIESYFHNLAGRARADFDGVLREPMTIDRHMLRAGGLPTEAMKTTGEPVARRGPDGQPITNPDGTPMVRGGNREVVATNRVEKTKAQQEMIERELRAAAQAKADARGTPITGREERELQKQALRRSSRLEPAIKMQASRPTAQTSKYMGSVRDADVAYEVIERNAGEAARRQGMTPTQAQAVLWFRQKYGKDLFGGERPSQGLPLDQQRTLDAATQERFDQTLAELPKSWSGRRQAAEDLIAERDTALARDVVESVEQYGGATFNVRDRSGRSGDAMTAVSIFPERQTLIPPAARTPSGGFQPSVERFVADNLDLLRDEKFSVGAWRIKQPTPAEMRAGKKPFQFEGRAVPDGTLILDVVATPSNGHNNMIAKTLGMDYSQFSVYDLGRNQEIATGGFEYAPGSPAARNAALDRKPEVYDRKAELDPARVPGRIEALRKDPRVTGRQRRRLNAWERRDTPKRRTAPTTATGTE